MNRTKLIAGTFSVLFMYSFTAYTQNKTIDSLQKSLLTQKEDTVKVNTLNAISYEYRYADTDSSLHFANQALALATKLNYQLGLADAKVRLSMLYATVGKYNEGVRSGEEATAMYNKLIASIPANEKERLLKRLANSYNVIAHNRLSQGNYPEGLKNSFLALKIREEIGSKKGIADCEFNIANAYYGQQNYAEAIKHYTVSLELSRELGAKTDMATAYSAIGFMYFEQGNYPEAIANYTASLSLAEEAGDKFTLAEIYSNLGAINNKQGHYTRALKYDFDALRLFREIGNNEQIAFIYNNIAEVYLNQKKYNNAGEYVNKALSFAKNIGKLDYVKLSYQNLAALDSSQGNYKDALQHYKMYIAYRDSVVNDENTRKILQQQMQYDFDKKEDSLKQQHLFTGAMLIAQKNQRYFYWGGIVMLSALSFFVFLNFRNQKRINRLAAEAHERQKADMELQHLNAVMQERLRISRELHDEVGATLSGIAMYSHLAKEQVRTNQFTEMEKSLNVMQQSSGEMVNKLNDIVWFLNPDQDSLQKLVERLEEYARDMAAIKSMQVGITVPDKISELQLPVESRRNIYLFCKEAINNAVKYSQGSLLGLIIKEIDGRLEFSVSDNGKGFDAVMVRRGNGLENMQKRADEIGAKLVLSSKENEGASLSLQCKIT